MKDLRTNIARKSVFAIAFCCLSLSLAAQSNVLFQQLVELNPYWLENVAAFPDEKMNKDCSGEQLIQEHLLLVEQHLRAKSVEHLSLSQKANRIESLDVLETYGNEALFPKNTRHAYTIPYFVDDFNTACAVGHLMRESGELELVQWIQNTQNNAFIKDLPQAELQAWADEHGFTLSELMWIQPSYGPPVNVDAQIEQPNCSTSNGAITLEVSESDWGEQAGGPDDVAALMYEWSKGQGEGEIIAESEIPAVSDLSADRYRCEFYEANTGWAYQVYYYLSDAEGPQVFASVTDETCLGAMNGRIDATVLDGLEVSYTWFNYEGEVISTEASLVNQAGHSFDSVDGSEYFLEPYRVILRAEDENNCLSFSSYLIGQGNNSVYINGFSSEIVEASCGGSDGSIYPVVAGGTGNYSYIWDTNETDMLSTEAYLENVPMDTYYLSVTDDQGCTDTYAFELTEECPAPDCLASFVFTQTGCTNTEDLTCSSAFDYYAFSNVSESSANATFFWDFGNGATSTDNQASDISFATKVSGEIVNTPYEVCLTITTDDGCEDTYCEELWVEGECNLACGCVFPDLIDPGVQCPEIFNPVCGCDGITYENVCFAQKQGVAAWTLGACGLGCDTPPVIFQTINDCLAENGMLYQEVCFSLDLNLPSPESANWVVSESGTQVVYSDVSEFCHEYLLYENGQALPYHGDVSFEGEYPDGCSYSTPIPVGFMFECFGIVDDCIEASSININAGCDAEFDPVCGCNGITYSNACVAENWGGVTEYTTGDCSNNPCDQDLIYSYDYQTCWGTDDVPQSGAGEEWCFAVDVSGFENPQVEWIVNHISVPAPFFQGQSICVGFNTLNEGVLTEQLQVNIQLNVFTDDCDKIEFIDFDLALNCIEEIPCNPENNQWAYDMIDDCYCQVDTFYYQNDLYWLFIPTDECNAVDLPYGIYDCQGNWLCSFWGEISPEDECDLDFMNASMEGTTFYNCMEEVVVIAEDDAFETQENSSISFDVLENDQFNLPIEFQAFIVDVSEPLGGTALFFEDGTITYTPNPGFVGMDQFTYVVCALSTCDTATVNINVFPLNNQSVLVQDDYFTITAGSSGQFCPLLNDVFDDLTYDLTYEINSDNIEVSEEGDCLNVTVQEGYTGTVNIQYTLCLANGDCDFGNIQILVIPSESLLLVDDYTATDLNTELVIYFLENDVFFIEEGQDFSIDLINTGESGNAFISSIDDCFGNNCLLIVYEPFENFEGEDVLTYELCIDGNCYTADVFISVGINCSEFCVWPGDANNNGLVNNIDILSIGLAYQEEGSLRPNASIDWVAQQSEAWAIEIDVFDTAFDDPNTEADTILLTSNAKYADCNGDGIINVDDVAAIDQNYSLTHGKGTSLRTPNEDAPNLRLVIPEETIEEGSWVDIEIHLDMADSNLENVYGIAFDVNYYNQYQGVPVIIADSTKFTYPDSWFSNDDLVLNVDKNYPALGRAESGYVRTNKIGALGNGEIITMSCFIAENIAGKGSFLIPLQFSIENAIMVNANGFLSALNVSNAETDVSTGTGLNANIAEEVHLYPVPASHDLLVEIGQNQLTGYVIYDIAGKMILRSEENQTNEFSIDVRGLQEGLYFLNLQTAEGNLTRKIQILK